jgi:hypothetical protein
MCGLYDLNSRKEPPRPASAGAWQQEYGGGDAIIRDYAINIRAALAFGQAAWATLVPPMSIIVTARLFPCEEAGVPGEQALGVKEWRFSIDC